MVINVATFRRSPSSGLGFLRDTAKKVLGDDGHIGKAPARRGSFGTRMRVVEIKVIRDMRRNLVEGTKDGWRGSRGGRR
jgi:hypothetical protein